MREKNIELALVKAVNKRGGIAPKFVSPGMDGVPDRIILMPEGRMAFAELKASGRKPRPLQLHRMKQLRQLGFQVYVIDNIEQIGGALDEISGT